MRECGKALLFICFVISALPALPSKDSSPIEEKLRLQRKLWPRQRILSAIKSLEIQRRWGILTERAYEKKLTVLKERLKGRYVSKSLSVANPPLNLIQNGGFEKVNRNSRPDRSRWLWWGGWLWGGNYENRWEDRPAYVHSGRYSARISCKGKPGRVGIMTPALPQIKGAEAYRLTFWAKGEGENRLFVNFESGARGSLRCQVPPQWTLYEVLGKPESGTNSFRVYFYHIGKGTIWLDDVRLVPVGQGFEGSRKKSSSR